MLLATLGAGLLKAQLEQVKAQLEQVISLIPPNLLNNFEIQSIIKMNLNLIMFIQEIIYLKQTIGHM